MPETLVPALDRLQAGVDRHLRDGAFLEEFHAELRTWVGRPTPLWEAVRLGAAMAVMPRAALAAVTASAAGHTAR